MAGDDDVVVTSDGRRIRPVKSVTKAIDLLDVLSTEGGPMGLTQLASAMRCSKTAAYNLLTTLELRGLVRKLADQRYALGWRLLELGEVVRSSSTFGDAARAHVIELAESTGETALLAVLDGETVMCVELVESQRSVPLSLSRGSRVMATDGAAGHVLLAFGSPARRRRLFERLDLGASPDLLASIDAVRADELAVVASEAEVSIAVPVFDYSGEAVAAVAVVGPASRLPSERVEQVVATVREAGSAISVSLGGAVRRAATRAG